MKTLFIFIVLAIIQGLTEPIPVSSSGHLVLAQALFKIESDDPTLEILLHLGSLIAIIIFYYGDVKTLIVDNLQYIFKGNRKKQASFDYFIKLVIATIPAGLIGILFKSKIEATLSNPKLVGVFLIFTAVVLASTYLVSKSEKQPITPIKALVIGIGQAVALLPGVSRSGMTTSTAMLIKTEPAEAMRFSFMMFIPIAVLVMLVGIPEIISQPDFFSHAWMYGIATIISGVVTYYAMSVLKLILKSRKYHLFSIYCFVVGVIALIIF